MGYTNYWQTAQTNWEDVPEGFVEEAKAALDKVIKSGVKLGLDNIRYKSAKEIFDVANIAGCTNKYFTIMFNGCDDNSCETFIFTTDGSNRFCKTNRCNYDIAVKAIIMLAEKYQLLRPNPHDGSYWDFDGKRTDQEFIDAYNLIN